MSYLVEAKDLQVEFPLSHNRKVHAVSHVSLGIREKEVLALVGESGCGKSTLGKALIRLIKPQGGQVLLEGVPLTGSRAEKKKMQIIFQDPYGSLNPRMQVGKIIGEPLETYQVCRNRQETKQAVLELMEAVGLSEEFYCRYPHQLSGGQRQRVGIARAIALKPAFIVCDEPVSALDVSVQNQILNLLKKLREQFGLTYLFISHDLSVVRFIADRTCIMFLGKLCELGDTETVYTNPLHPYTKFLLDAVPDPDPRKKKEKRMLLQGEIPSPVDPPSGCRFHTRCPYATARCASQEPAFREVQGRMVACHLYDDTQPN